MKLHRVDLKRQYNRYRSEIDAAIKGVIHNTAFIGGEYVRSFEENFARYCGKQYCVGCGNGTDALHLALVALGIGRGDEVIVPAHTFVATVEAVVSAGATPVFADIEPDTYTLDPGHLSSLINSRTRAVIPVHIYGHPCDMEGISGVLEGKDIFLIEDTAQAHGAILDGRMAGTFGVAGCFSFFPGKNLGAYGDAGGIVSDDETLVKKIRRIRNHGREGRDDSFEKGINSRLDGLQAAILDVKLKHLEDDTERRRKVAALYTSLLSDVPGVVPPVEKPGARHVYHLYVIRADRRDQLGDFLKNAGIENGVHYRIPCHRLTAFRGDYGGESLPETERAVDEILTLPIFPELQPSEVRYVVRKIREFYGIEKGSH